jgi:hypothetical protein
MRAETKLHRHLGKPLRIMEGLGRAYGRARDQPQGFRGKARKARDRARQLAHNVKRYRGIRVVTAETERPYGLG